MSSFNPRLSAFHRDRLRPSPPDYRNDDQREDSIVQEHIHMQDFIRSGATPQQQGSGITHGSWHKEEDEDANFDQKSLASGNGRVVILDRAPSFRTFGSNDAVQYTEGRGANSTWSHDQQPKELPLSEKELSSIMRKIDFRLLPVLMFIFFYTILDTSALVHSRLAGMSKTLHMDDSQYHTALVMYNIAHMIFVLPAMWCMERFGSKRWLSILVGTGGIFMLCTGFVQTPVQMIIMRFILGGLEAGMLPACIQTITLMYPRKSVQWRIALSTTGGLIGGLVGSFLAFGLTDIHLPNKHIQGWRMIFIIEGAITILAAPITYLMMPDSIQECTYLTSTQKVQYQDLRSRNANPANTINMSILEKVQLFFSSLGEIKSLLAFMILFAVNICFLGITINLPVMMKVGFGFNARDSQILPIPIKILTATLLLLVSYFSDRFERRILFVIGPAILGLIGFLGSLMATNGKTRYGLLFLGDLVHVAQPGASMILAQNIVCDTKRSAALGVGGFLTGLASIVASYLVWDKDAPRYFAAYSILSACSAIILISGGLLFLWLQRENRIKQNTINSRSVDHMSKEELRALGDKNPFFLYRY